MKISEENKELINFLRELVQAKSVNPYTPEESWKISEPIEKEVASLIYEKLKDFGLKPKFVYAFKNRPNVVCSLKNKGKPTLFFNSHMDTVDVGNMSKWKFNPFSAKIVDNKLFGRGAADAKGGLAAMVFAMKKLIEYKNGIDGNVIFTASVDEEPGACSRIGTKLLLDKGLKGDACIIGEPGSKKIAIGHRGVYRFKIITYGEAASTGTSEWERKKKGINAVTKMAKILLALENLKLKYRHSKIFPNRTPVITPGTIIKGGDAINVVPDKCEALCDVRLLPGQTKEKVKKQIVDCILKLQRKDSWIKFKIQDLAYVPSVYISKDERIVKVLKKVARSILKKDLKVEGAGPCSDAYLFINKNIPTVMFGPNGRNVHAENEFVFIDSIIKTCEIYTKVALEFCCKRVT
jgi:acetylornithine deacetylase/succinyl-diaminopimelate desuccinylase family protein